MTRPDRDNLPPAAPQGAVPAWRKALAAARDRLDGSVAQEVARELKALDFSNQAVLFGAGLLASLLPFLILLGTFSSARVDNYIALRLGLNRKASGVVTHLFASSHVSFNPATAIGVVFIVAGTLAVASSLRQIYEKAFHQSPLGLRGWIRLPIWIIGLCLTITLETVVARPVHNLPGGIGLVAVVTFAILTLFFWWTIHFLLAGRIPWRRLLPSAIATGILFAGLNVFSTFYFSRTIISNTRIYGAIGAVFSIMTWLTAIGAMIIIGAVAGAAWENRRRQRRPSTTTGLPRPAKLEGAILAASALFTARATAFALLARDDARWAGLAGPDPRPVQRQQRSSAAVPTTATVQRCCSPARSNDCNGPTLLFASAAQRQQRPNVAVAGGGRKLVPRG